MKKTCSTCGGTGQIGYFQGVSRFLLSWEECPQCAGTGYCESKVQPGSELQGDIPEKKKGSGEDNE